MKKDSGYITGIGICYVGQDGNQIARNGVHPGRLGDDEGILYMDIAKKALGGKPGKTLHTLAFPTKAEGAGTPHQLLMDIVESGGRQGYGELYDRITASYGCDGDYCILLYTGSYPVPGGAEEEGSEIYDFMLCAICPMTKGTYGLSYREEKGTFAADSGARIVGPPAHAFLFPAFEDRMADIHDVLFFSKKDGNLPESFLRDVLGCTRPIPASVQKKTFGVLLNEAMGDRCTYDRVDAIRDVIRKTAEDGELSGEEMDLDRDQLAGLLSRNSLLDQEETEIARKGFDAFFGKGAKVDASAIIDPGLTVVTAEDLTVKMKKDYPGSVSLKMVDGRKCLVIEVSDPVTLDGIRLSGTDS